MEENEITEKLEENIEDLSEKPIEADKLDEEVAIAEQMIEKEVKKEFLNRRKTEEEKTEEKLKAWVPKTQLGKEVKSGKIKNIDEILKQGRKILEPEIVD